MNKETLILKQRLWRKNNESILLRKTLIPQENIFACSPVSTPHGKCQLETTVERKQSKVQHQRKYQLETLQNSRRADNNLQTKEEWCHFHLRWQSDCVVAMSLTIDMNKEYCIGVDCLYWSLSQTVHCQTLNEKNMLVGWLIYVRSYHMRRVYSMQAMNTAIEQHMLFTKLQELKRFLSANIRG